MANRRMLSKSISTSTDVNKLSDFQSKLLFTWMIPHADDDGRMKGEPEYIKAMVVPMINWSPKDIQKYLTKMSNLNLIHSWEQDGDRFLHFPKWKSHQTIQSDRYHSSVLPPCPVCIQNGWIQAGYDLDTQSNISKDKKSVNKVKEVESEEKPHQTHSFKNGIINPNDFSPSNDSELAALEVWKKLEPHKPYSFHLTYLNAIHHGVPASVMHQFCSEINQDNSIENAGAVFNSKVREYLEKNQAK